MTFVVFALAFTNIRASQQPDGVMAPTPHDGSVEGRLTALESQLNYQQEVINSLLSSAAQLPPPLEPGVDVDGWIGVGAWSDLPFDKRFTLVCDWSQLPGGQMYMQCGWLPYVYP